MRSIVRLRVSLLSLGLALSFAPLPSFALTQGNYTYTINATGKATITTFTKSYSGALSITNTLGGCPVTSIGDQAFSWCTGLTGVTIPASVTGIGGWAFDGCTGLTGITIPANVTSIGGEAFNGCTGLTAIIVDGGNSVYSSTNGVLFNKGKSLLIQCPGGKAGSYTIPVGVTSIGSYAFEGCTGLTGVTIPAGVTSIGFEAFDGCTGLTAIIVDGGNSVYSSTNGVLFNKSQTMLIQCPGGKTGNYTIPGSVTSIGLEAFMGCAGLTNVVISAGVTNFGTWAFSYCTGLTGVTIPASVTAIGGLAFSYCTSLTAITVDGDNSVYSSTNGVLFNKSQTTLIQCPGGKTGSYAIPVGVTSIEFFAFEGCTGLTGVTIPGSVTSIGSGAFSYCTGLTGVTFPASVTGIGDLAFSYCTGLTGVYFNGNAPVLGSYVFNGANSATIYHLASATGWPAVPNIWGGRPTALWGSPVPPPPAPYIVPPEGGPELDTTGSYDGYFYGAGAFGGGAATAIRGTLTLKVTGLTGKLTAKATLQSTTLNFSATAWTATEADGSFRATLTAKSGVLFDLYVRQNRIWGTLAGGTLGGETFTLDGARNRFADRKDAAAQALLNNYRGYYTVALPAYDAQPLGTANAAPEGGGYLTLTVGAKGGAKIAGLLADGTKVSQSSGLILFDGSGPEACVPFFAPLYSRKGWVGGLLWIDPAGRTVVTDRDRGWFIRWEKPGSGSDGFSMLLDACGGYYGAAASLAEGYLFSADAGGVGYNYGSGVANAAGAALPAGIAVAVSGGRLAMAKGVKPTLTGGVYDYPGQNSAMATLSFKRGTGLFNGSFNLYYDYGLNGKMTHKTVKVPYAGVLTPVRGTAFATQPAGQGYCLVPDNDPALKAYRLKRSFPVYLDAAP